MVYLAHNPTVWQFGLALGSSGFCWAHYPFSQLSGSASWSWLALGWGDVVTQPCLSYPPTNLPGACSHGGCLTFKRAIRSSIASGLLEVVWCASCRCLLWSRQSACPTQRGGVQKWTPPFGGGAVQSHCIVEADCALCSTTVKVSFLWVISWVHNCHVNLKWGYPHSVKEHH